MTGRLPKSFTLTNRTGMRVRILDFGARIASIQLPLPSGRREVCLGYDQPADWLDDPYYLGAICGRYANRIADASFSLNGNAHQLDRNLGNHHLHGGSKGFSSYFWKVTGARSDQISLSHHSPDGDMGYPGNLLVRVTYRLADSNQLDISFEAQSDKDTVVSLTSHSYFNLAGSVDAAGHRIETPARQFTVVDADNIPTGAVAGMYRLPDLSKMDHNLVLPVRDEIEPAATLISPDRAISMDVFTSYPGLQVYGGMHLGPPFTANQACCLEPQFYPDSPNKPGFPSPVLRAGDIFRHCISYLFSWSERAT